MLRLEGFVRSSLSIDGSINPSIDDTRTKTGIRKDEDVQNENIKFSMADYKRLLSRRWFPQHIGFERAYWMSTSDGVGWDQIDQQKVDLHICPNKKDYSVTTARHIEIFIYFRSGVSFRLQSSKELEIILLIRRLWTLISKLIHL